MILLKTLTSDFDSYMHSAFVAYDDQAHGNLLKILHQAKMLKAFLQISKINVTGQDDPDTEIQANKGNQIE